MDVKEKVRVTMSSINRKINSLFAALNKTLGVRLAAYVSEDGLVLINTPSDVISVGDAVLVEQEGVINDKANWQGKIIGADGEYQVVIVDGIVKELTKIESESAEEMQAQTQGDTQVIASMNRVVAMNEVMIKEIERLKSEINDIKKQNSTLWNTLQKQAGQGERKVSSKLSKLRDIYNNV
jgi:hypothetical protein